MYPFNKIQRTLDGWGGKIVGKMKNDTKTFGKQNVADSKMCLIGCCLVHGKWLTNVYQILHLHFYKKTTTKHAHL